MTLSQGKFNEAVQAAREGDTVRARTLLRACLEDDPTNAAAWVWLSEVSDSTGEKVRSLASARDCYPQGSPIRERIEARLADLLPRPSLQTPDLPPPLNETPYTPPFARDPEEQTALDEQINQAVGLAKSGQRAGAAALLETITETHPESERVWRLLCKVSRDPVVRIRALEHALIFRPADEAASRELERLRRLSEDPMKLGAYLERQGEGELAIRTYTGVTVHSRSAAERVEALRRIERIQLRQEGDSLHKVDPTANLIRLAVGPVLLFAMMVFMQSGLNPLHLPFLVLPGLASVTLGSLILSATDMRPVHPLWAKLVGKPETGDEPEMRRGLRLLGWALLATPYTMFFIEAGQRLGALQSSMFPR
jgi:hypothetical protein